MSDSLSSRALAKVRELRELLDEAAEQSIAGTIAAQLQVRGQLAELFEARAAECERWANEIEGGRADWDYGLRHELLVRRHALLGGAQALREGSK